MTTYLLKTEPTTYSYDNLARDKKTVCDGVASPAALANTRRVHKGDQAFVYHTGDEKQIVGLASIASEALEDPRQPGKTPDGAPKFAVFEIRALKKAARPLTLAAMKADKRFAGFDLLRLPRLSVMPVPPEHDRLIRELTGLGDG